MSLYAKYLVERTNDKILETNHGFATYRFLLGEKSVYLIDIFVDSDFRNSGKAAQMADEIAALAREQGCTKMLGSVVPSTKGSTASLRVLLTYGMSLKSATNDFIVMEKDI